MVRRPEIDKNSSFESMYKKHYQKTSKSMWGEAPSEGIVWLTDELEAMGKRAYKVLDIGCGEGRNSLYLAKRGFEVIGLDIAPAAINKAQSISLEEGVMAKFLVGDLCNIPFKNFSFDVIIDVFTMTFVINIQKYVNEILRILAKDGLLYMEYQTHEQDKDFEEYRIMIQEVFGNNFDFLAIQSFKKDWRFLGGDNIPKDAIRFLARRSNDL